MIRELELCYAPDCQHLTRDGKFCRLHQEERQQEEPEDEEFEEQD